MAVAKKTWEAGKLRVSDRPIVKTVILHVSVLAAFVALPDLESWISAVIRTTIRRWQAVHFVYSSCMTILANYADVSRLELITIVHVEVTAHSSRSWKVMSVKTMPRLGAPHVR